VVSLGNVRRVRLQFPELLPVCFYQPDTDGVAVQSFTTGRRNRLYGYDRPGTDSQYEQREELNKALVPYDLKFIEKPAEIEMLVIRNR